MNSKSYKTGSTSDDHERARRMIASSASGRSGPEILSRSDESWLAIHLQSCASCREFAENSSAAVRLLRGISIAADRDLVSLTQMRVRRRAHELRLQQERFWVICVCCAAVTLSAAFTTAVVWIGFTSFGLTRFDLAWIGREARLSSPLWQSCFVVLYLLPAVVAGISLLARGTFLADQNGGYPH